MKLLKHLLALALVLILVLQLMPAGLAADAEPAATVGAKDGSEAAGTETKLPKSDEPAPSETDREEEPAQAGEEQITEERQFGTGWAEEDFPPANNWISDARLAQPQADRSIPAKYDSRDSGIVTPVRNQGGYGTC